MDVIAAPYLFIIIIIYFFAIQGLTWTNLHKMADILEDNT